MIKKINKVMNKLASGSSLAASVWVFIIMVFICVDVVARLAFNSPVIGAPEIVQNSIASIAFLMIPWATYLGQHVRATMLKDRVSPKAGFWLDIISFSIGFSLFAVIIYASIGPAVFATRIRDFQGEGLRVPIYPVWWIIIFGSFLACYQCLSKVVRAALLARGHRNVESLREHGGMQI